MTRHRHLRVECCPIIDSKSEFSVDGLDAGTTAERSPSPTAAIPPRSTSVPFQRYRIVTTEAARPAGREGGPQRSRQGLLRRPVMKRTACLDPQRHAALQPVWPSSRVTLGGNTEVWDRRPRRRGPPVRQERGRADGSIAQSAPPARPLHSPEGPVWLEVGGIGGCSLLLRERQGLWRWGRMRCKRHMLAPRSGRGR